MPRNYQPKRDLEYVRGAIIEYYKAKRPTPRFTHIVRFFQDTLKPTLNFVKRTIDRYNDTGSVSDRPRAGRPNTTTPAVDLKIVLLARQKPLLTLYQIQEELYKKKLYLTEAVIVQRLHSAGIHSYMRRPKPLLTAKHKATRLAFANANIGLNFSKWIFSDECSVSVFPSHVKQRVWRKCSDSWDAEFSCTPIVRQSTKLMVWACAGMWGKGPLLIHKPVKSSKSGKKKKKKKKDKTITAIKYLSVLKSQLPALQHKIGPDAIFQHDNARVHTAAIVTQWLQHRHTPVVDWPPCSPDLSPLENLWTDFKRRVWDRSPKTIADLPAAIRGAWKSFTNEEVSHYFSNVEQRLRDVVDSQGGSTKY
jgi:transposase